MNIDQFGICYASETELADMLYLNPDMKFHAVPVTDAASYNHAVQQLHLDLPLLTQYRPYSSSIESFDHEYQTRWFMPEQYKTMDIAAWLLNQCSEQAQLQRVGQELLMYQERNLFPLLCYLKYLVDTMRENNIVWGVGRGSSVASYVLYLIGIHKIDSIYYDLDIEEFLKGS